MHQHPELGMIAFDLESTQSQNQDQLFIHLNSSFMLMSSYGQHVTGHVGKLWAMDRNVCINPCACVCADGHNHVVEDV